jgi:hypothetical protein
VDSSVAVQEVEAPPPATPRVIGRICATGHTRIVHYEPGCPLCAAALLLEAAATRVEQLIDEAHYRESELQTLRDQALEAGEQ